MQESAKGPRKDRDGNHLLPGDLVCILPGAANHSTIVAEGAAEEMEFYKVSSNQTNVNEYHVTLCVNKKNGGVTLVIIRCELVLKVN